MQKIAKFLEFWLIFMPAIILLVFSESWLGIIIGAFNPVKAIDFIKKNTILQTEIISAASPFENFTIPQLSKNKDATTKSPAYHPMYNIQEEFFSSSTSNIILQKDACYVKNLTHHTTNEVKQLMLAPVNFSVEKNSDQPQILIYHTHATESYTPTDDMTYNPAYSWRSTDTSQNMVAVGKVITDTLNSMGYNTIQDTTLHDHPSYNGSYDLSKATVEKYLKMYPSIKVVLDIHRDAVERDGAVINPVVSYNGDKYAQIMIISGCDSGYMNMPNYRENLKFATNLQNTLEKELPGLTRPVLFDYRNYNQQLSTGSLLVEFGTHGSTLQQAKNSRKIFAQALAKTLDNI